MSAMPRLREAGFVHGDLRDTSILVDVEADDDDVRFVSWDWDWAGRKEGPSIVEYPVSINHQV